MRKSLYYILAIICAVLMTGCRCARVVSADHITARDSVSVSRHDSIDVRAHMRDSINTAYHRLDSIYKSHMRDSIWTDRAHYERAHGDTLWIKDTVTHYVFRYSHDTLTIRENHTDTVVLVSRDTIYVVSADSTVDRSTLSDTTNTTVAQGKTFAEYSGILLWVGVAVAVVIGLIVLAIKIL